MAVIPLFDAITISRQEQLVRRLGQIQCPGKHDGWVFLFGCSRCGAVL